MGLEPIEERYASVLEEYRTAIHRKVTAQSNITRRSAEWQRLQEEIDELTAEMGEYERTIPDMRQQRNPRGYGMGVTGRARDGGRVVVELVGLAPWIVAGVTLLAGVMPLGRDVAALSVGSGYAL